MAKRPGTRLPWLPAQPEDFRKLSADIDRTSGPRGEALRRLAGHALDVTALIRLARSIGQAVGEGLSSPLQPVTLGLVSNASTDFVVPALVGSAARHGVALKIVAAPFGVTTQAALDDDSELRRARPDFILLALDYRAFRDEFRLDAEPDVAVNAAVEQMRSMVELFAAATGATIIVQTLAPSPERLFGSFDRRQPGTTAWFISRFNSRLCDEIVKPGVSLLDVEGLASAAGLDEWYDRPQWLAARLPFAQTMLPLYGEHAARLLAAASGRSRKVLVLDLDNTLWKGVVGDDGVEGLRIAQGDPVGEAHLDLQRAALALKNRGVLLALCSKNDESLARRVFQERREMLLREEDFAAVQINWNDKASNLEAIAAELSLGLDSFVFLDDNPAEREQVRTALPQVSVLEVPNDPTCFGRRLMTAGVFEAVAFSDEDRARAEQYAGNSRRNSLMASSRDLSSFLESLDMTITFVSRGAQGWTRFAQLINKSNQFNLTTRRVTEAEILRLAEDGSGLALQAHLSDKFGDNGMISAIICRPIADGWEIDTWVMSCRVLGRKVESAVLNEIVRQARRAGVAKIRGIYKATARNDMVRDHYRKLGFSPLDVTEAISRWELDVATFSELPTPIVASTLAIAA